MKSARITKTKPSVNSPIPAIETPCLRRLQINNTMPRTPRLYPAQFNQISHSIADVFTTAVLRGQANYGA